jgi:hypothetical protein
MANNSDWLSGTRQGQLSMAKVWQEAMDANKTPWNIPPSAVQELSTLISAAESALYTAQNEATRTPVATARCKTAFEALTAFMRDAKRRFFLTPPLVDADYISLGLRRRDSTATASGLPTAQAMVETYLIGRHELGVRITYVTGNPGDSVNKGYRIWYSVVAPGETPPTNPDDLHKSFYTKRKKDVIEFEFGDSGKTAYFAMQIENEGKKGPWGPLVSALIP